jgi:hypothetical protein
MWKMGTNRLKVGLADPESALIALPFVWVTATWFPRRLSMYGSVEGGLLW